MTSSYDVIVIGARCAGSPTAMLLARSGYRVLVVDRAELPSDTLSTHLINPPGIAALRRWGLLDRLVATGCPPIDTYQFDFGPAVITGSPAIDDAPVAYAPRRTVLDELLVRAAAEAGAEVRERFTVDELIVEDGRVTGIRGDGGTERARVVVGADGRHSLVARTVRPEEYHTKPPLLAGYYSYWSGFPTGGRFETYLRPYRGCALWPTHDDLTMIIAGWPYAEFDTNRRDIEANYLKTLELMPPVAERLATARREARLVGTPVHNFFRKPYGPGWALVGDAGYNKDYITAQGIQDAFNQAELFAAALDDALSGTRPFDVAMDEYQATRDSDVLPMYEFTCQLAPLDPPPPELAALFGAVAGNQTRMDEFVRLAGGAISPADYFAEPNVGRIFAEASR